jgi:hypothetical protein
VLLAIRCLRRCEDGTEREAEVRLREHAELRAAVAIERAPDSTTRSRCWRRTGEQELTRLVQETIRRLPPSPEGGTTVAVDGTGLAPGAISTFFVNRVRDQGAGRTWRHWRTWVVVVALPRRLILAQVAKPGPTNAGAMLRPLLERARHLVPIRQVLAEGAFDRERKHPFIRQVVGADRSIPAKRGKQTGHLQGVRAQMRADFPAVPKRPRALIESVFSATQRTLSARAAGRSAPTHERQALLLGVAFTLSRLRRWLPLKLALP